ncbi:MAG: M20/M25/M40 family metallo-hydrolase [Litorimonas sp.]
MTQTRRNSICLTFALIALTLAFTFSLSFVAPPSPDTDHAFDTGAAMARLSRILGDERPHPVDTDANDAVRERLLTEIRTLGFDPIVRDDFRCTDHFGGVCARVRNVMFWAVPPIDDATQGVALMSHYDSVPAGPGAGDDGAGVAVGLEVARLLKDRGDLRPVLILITDGEEIGLLGAESFVHSDPLAARIDAVVNVEARGVRGPISMFQTSNPNARDIAAIAKTGRTALTNTLTTSIYEAMPNDTDISRFLDADAPRQVDATNFAFILGDSFYHTPGDNLANLNPGTLFHSGINALAAVEQFAARPTNSAPEGDRLYFDVLTRGVISVPAGFGSAIILLSGLLSIVALVRKGTWRGWRGWVLIPVALISVGLATVALSAALGALKSGAAYSPAHPWALRGAVSAIAVLVAASIAIFLRGQRGNQTGALLKSWLWVSGLAILGLFVFPSTMTFFVGALFIVCFAAIAALLKRDSWMVGLSGLAAFIYIIINLPMLGFALAGLGGTAAPFAMLWTIPVVIIAIALPTQKQSRLPLFSLGTVTVALIAAAIFVPTHTANAPRGLSIQHIVSDTGSFVQLSGHAKPPQAMMDSGDPTESTTFTYAALTGAKLPAYARPRWTLAINSAPDIDASITVLSDIVERDTRRVSLRIIAPTADRLHLAPASSEAMWTSLSANDVAVEPTSWGLQIAGRSVRDIQIDITLPANQPMGQIAVTRFGLGGDMAALTASRPDWTLPRQAGDTRVRLLDIDRATQP